MHVAPYGEWTSPITAEAVVAASSSLSRVQCVDGDVYWSESRPDEGGRIQIVRHRDGVNTDLLGAGQSARTRVHEYGGGAWVVAGNRLFFSEWSDHRLHRLDLDTDGAASVAISPEPPAPAAHRYADLRVVGDWLVCVRERHDTGGEAANELVAVHVDGAVDPVVLHSGPDFVAAPRCSADGTNLAWFEWNHPDMPWDSTTAYRADLHHDAATISLSAITMVGGGEGISVCEPRFRGNDLHLISDRSAWWNVYEVSGTNLTPIDAEVGMPHWVFGSQRYGWLDDGRLVFAALADGFHRLYLRDHGGKPQQLDLPYSEITALDTHHNSVVMIAGAPGAEAAIVEVTPEGAANVLRPARTLPFDAGWISEPRAVSFPSSGRTTHALYYPPVNPDTHAPEGTAPPLLVKIHGGPTSAARPQLDLEIQYWTSRGFAVVDVNYAGSTGYGRRYRRLLDGAWGIADVEDCVAAARWLARQGLADPDRLCIRGGSAGGFTTLAALANTDAFAAGCSKYGIADLRVLAEETHKFEARYADTLIGPYPEAREVYDERSPINHLDGFDRPLIVFQGLEDEVVPPNQSEMIVDALRERGVPVAYLAFEGEQHGFRKAETTIAVLQAELAFYGKVLGFSPADDLPDIAIANLPET